MQLYHSPQGARFYEAQSAHKRRDQTDKEKSIDVTYKDFPVGKLAIFLLYTGCRKGEALALTHADVDTKAKVLHITKSVYYKSNDPHLK